MSKNKIPAALFFSGISGLIITFTLVPKQLKLIFLLVFAISIALIFISISLKVIYSENGKQLLYKKIFLGISITFLLLCLLSFYFRIPGTNIEGVLAVFFYCFAYAPLELSLKYRKWLEYTDNRWEVFLLSWVDFIGLNLVLLGILAIVLNWPGQMILLYSGSTILILGLFFWNNRFKTEIVKRKLAEDKIKEQYIQIESEKQISEKLLMNILPEEVAQELKAKGKADAKFFDEVTVLFTDFKDFTKVAEKMTANELVEEINTCFMAFDQIMDTYGIEKIKTIGDSYMCAGGLPVSNTTHASDVVKAALDIQSFIQAHFQESLQKGKHSFQIRIGIHTGPVVAGIVGIKKFAYDIWGDTVNTASRMESSGEVGKVNISETTYQLVKDKFICTHRGKINAKGKGEMDMYFVEQSV